MECHRTATLASRQVEFLREAVVALTALPAGCPLRLVQYHQLQSHRSDRHLPLLPLRQVVVYQAAGLVNPRFRHLEALLQSTAAAVRHRQPRTTLLRHTEKAQRAGLRPMVLPRLMETAPLSLLLPPLP